MKKITAIIILLLQAACTVYEPIQIVPDHLQNVKIDQFDNKTQQIGLSLDLTQYFTDEFIRDGRLTVDSGDDPDSILRGEIVEYSKIPIAYDENFVAQEYKLSIVIDLKYYDKVEEVMLWSDEREGLVGGIEAWVKYYVGDDVEFVETEDEARERLLRDIAKKIMDRTVYGWE